MNRMSGLDHTFHLSPLKEQHGPLMTPETRALGSEGKPYPGCVMLRTGTADVLHNRMATRGTAQAQANAKEIQVQPGRARRGLLNPPALPWHRSTSGVAGLGTKSQPVFLAPFDPLPPHKVWAG